MTIAAKVLAVILRIGAVLLVANEIRGMIMVLPVMAALYHSGGDLMAIWIAFCSLAGIALSVIVPLFLARKAERLVVLPRQ